jgi:hypothetical protein
VLALKLLPLDTDESDRSSRTPESLDKTRFGPELRFRRTQFEELCDPQPVLELDKMEFLHSLTKEQMALLVPVLQISAIRFWKGDKT